jgi:uncharacterized protein (TIGR00251 family)
MNIEQIILSKKSNKDELLLSIRTNASKTRILSYDSDKDLFFMDVSEKPENNKANHEIIRFFKKHFGADIKILGLKSKRKRIIFKG